MHRKKNTFLYVFLLILIFSLIFTILPLFNSIIDTLHESSVAKYGNYDFVLYDVSDEDISTVNTELKNYAIKKVGLFDNYGNWKIAGSNQTITLGNFDKNALDLSCIRLLEGHMPKNESEIALEQNIQFHLAGSPQLGDEISILIDGQSVTYIISGILSNYVSFWDVPQDSVLVKGVNDLPQGFIHENSLTVSPKKGAIVNCGGDSFLGGHIARELDIDYSINSNTDGAREGMIQPLKTFRNLFMIIVIFGIFLALNLGLNLYIESYQTTYTTLYQLGAEGEYPFYLYVCQQFWALIFSTPFGIFVAWVFSIFVSPIIGSRINIFAGDTLILFASTIILVFCFVLYKFYRKIYRKRAASLSIVKSKKKLIQLQIGRNFSWALATNFMDIALKKVIPLLLLIALLFSTIGFTQVYFQENLESSFALTIDDTSNMRYPDFTIDTAQFHSYGTLEILKINLDKNRVMEKNVVQNLYQEEGIEYVRVLDYAYNQATFLVPRINDPYWVDQDITQYMDTEMGYVSSNIKGAPDIKDYFAAYHDFFVIDDEVRQAIFAAYPDKAEIIQTLDENEVILFLPPRENGVENKTYKVGDNLLFGELEYEDDFFAAWNDPSLLTYKEHRLVIKDIVPETFGFEIAGMHESSYGPIILVSEETFLNHDLFKGIQRFDVFLDSTISEEGYINVEEEVRKIGMSYNNSSVFSRKEQAAQDIHFVTIINTALVTMLLFLGIFVIACLAIVLYMTLLQRKQSIAMMRAIGMPRRTLSRAIFMEVCMYMLYCFVISVAVYFLMMYLIFGVFFSTSVSIANTLLMMRSLGICIIGMLFICSLVIHFLLNSIEKESISMAMRSVS